MLPSLCAVHLFLHQNTTQAIINMVKPPFKYWKIEGVSDSTRSYNPENQQLRLNFLVLYQPLLFLSAFAVLSLNKSRNPKKNNI